MPATVVFVGTHTGLKIYRLGTDGGKWSEAGPTLASSPVRAIVAADAEILLVAIENGGVQQSFDGGATWSASAESPPEPVGVRVMTRNGPVPLANPRLSGATAYARLGGRTPTLIGAGAGGALLFRSSDDGIHWEPAGMAAGHVGRIVAIIPDPLNASAAWAGSDRGALLHTRDSGATWQIVADVEVPILCLAAAAG